MSKGDVYDVILKKFAGELTNNDIDLDDKGEEEQETERYPLQLTKFQRFEFRAAFRVVAGEGVASIHKDQVVEVIEAMGYTFQDSDIEELLRHCEYSNDGYFSSETLLQAFEVWMSEEMINKEEMHTLFNMCALRGELTDDFPRDNEEHDFALDENGLYMEVTQGSDIASLIGERCTLSKKAGENAARNLLSPENGRGAVKHRLTKAPLTSTPVNKAFRIDDVGMSNILSKVLNRPHFVVQDPQKERIEAQALLKEISTKCRNPVTVDYEDFVSLFACNMRP